MSRIGSAYTIDYQAQNEYVVEGRTGAEAEPMTESQVNALLADDTNTNMRVQDGQLYLTGDQPYTTQHDMALNFGGPPTLPSISGSRLDGVTLSERLDSADFSSLNVGSHAWEALCTLVRSGFLDRRTSRELRLALEESKWATKRLSIEETRSKIESEKSAAWERFAWAMAATVASALMAGAGGAMGASSKAASSAAYRGGAMALTGAAQGLGQAMTAIGDAISKESGAQYRANQSEIRAKELDLHAEQLDAALEDAKANEQESKEAAQQALKLIQQMVENQTQAIQKITGI